MKTTLELPDELMRAIKVQAASTDRKLKDLVAELIERGLGKLVSEASRLTAPEAATVAEPGPGQDSAPGEGVTLRRDDLDALFAAGDALARGGIDVTEWAAHSREVWR